LLAVRQGALMVAELGVHPADRVEGMRSAGLIVGDLEKLEGPLGVFECFLAWAKAVENDPAQVEVGSGLELPPFSRRGALRKRYDQENTALTLVSGSPPSSGSSPWGASRSSSATAARGRRTRSATARAVAMPVR